MTGEVCDVAVAPAVGLSVSNDTAVTWQVLKCSLPSLLQLDMREDGSVQCR